jgi:hypothetical protein
VTCPIQEAIFAFELRQAPEGPNMASGKILGLLEEVLDGVFHASRRRSIRLPRPCRLRSSYDCLVVTVGSTIRAGAIERYD